MKVVNIIKLYNPIIDRFSASVTVVKIISFKDVNADFWCNGISLLSHIRLSDLAENFRLRNTSTGDYARFNEEIEHRKSWCIVSGFPVTLNCFAIRSTGSILPSRELDYWSAFISRLRLHVIVDPSPCTKPVNLCVVCGGRPTIRRSLLGTSTYAISQAV